MLFLKKSIKMKSREIQLIEYFISNDTKNMNCAIEKMFFAQNGHMMSSFQKAAFDAIQRKFNGPRYAQFSVREKYETVMSSGVIDKVIEVLKRDKASFIEQYENGPEAQMPKNNWTSQYKNINGYIGIIIEREANKNRAYIDAILGLEPEFFTSVSLDDNIKKNFDVEDEIDQISNGNMLLISALYEGISNLKHEKDKDILQSIIIEGMSDEDYANKHGIDISALYRDKARARDRLIIEMVSSIQRRNKTLVGKYSYLLDEYSRELVFDVIIREISFQDAAAARGIRVSEVQTKFTSAYSKIIKNYNLCRSDYLEEIGKEERKLKKIYDKYLSRLSKMGAIPENKASLS